ncbi:hypothetical protein ISF_07067 [Cordyceps fumosorosea ARSEF 2679]|uniref:Uncharacterized protein n=1 Tax=Cordyceps fumosorosea (strain ARSEF 2679) TaxID=1081104 RepID=A0A167QPH9_CORFA|nr:hypothetical protein ISF_07067 [Cordyceps fumosorosea ARSEF 2679]OAA57826.1 hypothetical protein ISF_07067 [Cordyceps fumosorosea ARSEF 2679]
MATEPAFNKLAEVSVSHQLNNHPNGAQHGVDYSALNGGFHNIEDIANKRITSVEEQLHSTDVSVSGGSDTEASRAKDGEKSHSRTGSAAKKPAMFKAVSVNKTFLAAKANSSSIVSRTTERPSGGSNTPPPGSSAISASRPRLVAKAGNGARDSVPRFTATNGSKSGSVPDANAVWNKNRPPEPKKFTDEELKKYGIHMASRLNEDDAQGQNKWADIDDDDDDWAPEAITWGDGTKTKLPHPDEHPPQEDVSHGSQDRFNPKHEVPGRTPQSEYTIPKPAGLPSGKGLVLKGATQDRPALVAKPPQPPAPAKSPWAQLPPVERPQQPWSESTGSPRGSYKEPSPLKMMAPPPKEIAADDFNRSSWRDSHAGSGGRELYNSQSGRLEPVPDRRGSMLSDHSSRQLAVLQRQANDHPEPSSAFQTSRTSHDGSFNRRRASSNVSGGSGFLQRGARAGEGQSHYPSDDRGHRRPSFSGSNEGRYTQHNMNGPNRQHPLWNNAETSDLTHAEPPMPQEDDVEYQKKLMKERVELARKRRQEEVAREEAALKERIQKKLEALGPAPEKKHEKKDAPGRDEPRPTQIHRRERSVDKQVSHHANTGPKDPTSRRLSQTQEQQPAESWSGTSPRPDRLSAWGTGPNGLGRNVWGSPDNDRGLGNGTFNPDLGRIPGATGTSIQTANGPQPLSLPPAMQTAPIGSRSSRYDGPGTDLASKWVAAVADSDKKLNATRLAEHVNMERQLAERGISADDAQPVIKETWRQVHAPGDGTRQVVNATKVPMHTVNAWKAPREDPRHAEQPNPSVAAGVIGSAPPHMLAQNANASSQPRTSRFFPAREQRLDSPPDTIRPSSPSAPPPTMEGHPAYEGDARRPQVSLPKPQPIVKLPPSASQHQQTPSNRQQPAWSNKGPPNGRGPQPYGHQSQRSAESSQEQWQDRINSLLHKVSPPKPTIGMYVVNVASRSGYDHNGAGTAATVVLPGSPRQPQRLVSAPKPPESKPMAEECFEEQEMGSLPIIRLPTKTPDAAWQPVVVQLKPLPRRYLVHASSIMEPFRVTDEHSGNSGIIRVHLPGMQWQKTVAFPQTTSPSRGGRGNGRPSPRHRGGGRGGKREAPNSHGDSPTNHGRGGRGGYRAKGSDNWNRNSSRVQSQTQLSS